MTFDAQLRALIAEVVREELARAAARPEEYLSTREAADTARVAPGTVRRWIREGRLTGQHAGRTIRVKRSDLEAFLRSGPGPSNDLSPEALARRDFG